MLHIYLNHTNDTQMRKQKMILDNTNPHAHKSYEIKEGINGEGKIIHLVNTLVDSSIVWSETFETKSEAELWLKYSCA